MQKATIAFGAGFVLAVGLLIQSSLTASSLKTQVASLEEAKRSVEQEKRDLATRLEAEQQIRAALEGQLKPLVQRESAIREVNAEVVVPAGTTQMVSFTPTMVPGTLSGRWRSSGEGSGAMTNSITGLRLMDPQDHALKTFQNAAAGDFTVKITAPGTYTFYMDNTGLFTMRSRKVFIESEFRPD